MFIRGRYDKRQVSAEQGRRDQKKVQRMAREKFARGHRGGRLYGIEWNTDAADGQPTLKGTTDTLTPLLNRI